MDIEKVIRDNKVAVLYSPHFGAGWSSWVGHHLKDFAMFDSGLVELAENSASFEEVNKYMQSKLPVDDCFYTGGWEDIEIRWIPVGTRFQIN